MKASLVLLALGLVSTSRAAILLSENFDGGSVNSTFTYTGASTANVGGSHGNVAQLTTLTGSNNNSIAFNSVTVPSTPVLRMGFDFFMSDDASNNNNGGCCGEAADGFAIGFFPNAAYGATGASNPSTSVSPFAWEDGVVPGVPALVLAFDIFEANNVSIGWNGNNLVDTAMSFQLNNNAWHRAVMTITDVGANSLIDVSIDGNAIYTGIAAAGVDLDAIASNYRLIAGGRTGGAFVSTQMDNIVVEAVPEPSTALMGGVGLLALASRRRRKA